MYVSGRPDREPLRPYGNQSFYLASLFAANGILLALRWRRRSGQGQYIDISLQEAVAASLEHVLVQYFNEGIVPWRQGALQWNCSSDLFPCRDKYVLLTFNREWDTLVELLDQPAYGRRPSQSGLERRGVSQTTHREHPGHSFVLDMHA